MITTAQQLQKNNFLVYFNKYMPLATDFLTAEQSDISHKDVVSAVSDSMDATVAGFAMADTEQGQMAAAAASLAKISLPLIVSLFHRNKAKVAFTADPAKAPPIPTSTPTS